MIKKMKQVWLTEPHSEFRSPFRLGRVIVKAKSNGARRGWEGSITFRLNKTLRLLVYQYINFALILIQFETK